MKNKQQTNKQKTSATAKLLQVVCPSDAQPTNCTTDTKIKHQNEWVFLSRSKCHWSF